MSALTTDILAEANRLLAPERFDDYGPNGLQVPGPVEVNVLASGVSAHAELFELAAGVGAQLLLVHHGLFWGAGTQVIDPVLKRRLQIPFEADMALAAYHLPLDAHPEIGNNALIARALGAGELQRFAEHRGEPIGILAALPDEGLMAGDLFAAVAGAMGREPLVFDAGPARVRAVAIVSGAGSDYIEQAAAAGAQAFITGEPAERVMAQARELGIHFIAAGHYATETFGIRSLGDHLAERFCLRHVFLDAPNPI
jgi:dinuclear metal center YbgI/SA1388 family protein